MPPYSPAATARANGWVRIPVPRPAARLRLLCFHPAGGGPSMFRGWPAGLPEDIEVLAVQLPGREARLSEACLTTYRSAIEQLGAALRPYLDRPYALFGHSMGALLAYGVAVTAGRHGERRPTRLLVSGCPGPGSVPAEPGRADRPDEELIADLRSMGGTPEGVFADRDLLDLILPTLRADFALCDSYRRPDGPRLDCPVSVFGGEDDTVRPEDLQRWSGATHGSTTVRTFPGGHFFLTEQSAPAVLAAVSADLA